MPALTVDFAFVLAALMAMASACVCFIAWLTASEIRAAGEDKRGLRTALLAGLAGGAGVWALPFLSAPWPHSLGFSPVLAAVALLVIAIGVAVGSLLERRFLDGRGLVAGGALLGAAIPLGQGLVLLGITGPMTLNLDNVPIATAVAVASPLTVGALLARRRLPPSMGKPAAIFLLTLAAELSQIIERRAVVPTSDPLPALGFDLGSLPAEAMPPVAGLTLAAALLILRKSALRPPVSRATRGLAWRESPRTFPARRQAETGSPHPTPGR